MKRVIYLLVLQLCLLVGCQKDDDVSPLGVPSFQINTETSQLEPVPGELMYIRGLATAELNLKTIEIKIPAWELNKSIDLSGFASNSFDLDYKFLAPEDAGAQDVDLTVVVTDESGTYNAQQFTISATGSAALPEIYLNRDIMQELPSSIALKLMGDTYTYPLSIDLYDTVGLKSVEVSCEELDGYSRSISISGNEYTFADNLSLPNGIYNIVVEATNSSNNVTKGEFSLVVSAYDLVKYDKLYLADVDTAADLTADLYGIPYLANEIDADNYRYSALYYSREANTEVRFVAAKDNFDVCFGANAQDQTKLVAGDNTINVTPIILTKAEQYYNISIDLATGSVSVEEVSMGTDPNAESDWGIMCMLGFPDIATSGSEVFANVKSMTSVGDNTYLRSIDIDLSSSVAGWMKFYFCDNDSWSPYWKFISKTYDDGTKNLNTLEEVGVQNNTSGETVSYCWLYFYSYNQGKYTFYFDSKTLRTWAVPAEN